MEKILFKLTDEIIFAVEEAARLFPDTGFVAPNAIKLKGNAAKGTIDIFTIGKYPSMWIFNKVPASVMEDFTIFIDKKQTKMLRFYTDANVILETSPVATTVIIKNASGKLRIATFDVPPHFAPSEGTLVKEFTINADAFTSVVKSCITIIDASDEHATEAGNHLTEGIYVRCDKNVLTAHSTDKHQITKCTTKVEDTDDFEAFIPYNTCKSVLSRKYSPSDILKFKETSSSFKVCFNDCVISNYILAMNDASAETIKKMEDYIKSKEPKYQVSTRSLGLVAAKLSALLSLESGARKQRTVKLQKVNDAVGILYETAEAQLAEGVPTADIDTQMISPTSTVTAIYLIDAIKSYEGYNKNDNTSSSCTNITVGEAPFGDMAMVSLESNATTNNNRDVKIEHILCPVRTRG